jgi:hypothetical protein
MRRWFVIPAVVVFAVTVPLLAGPATRAVEKFTEVIIRNDPSNPVIVNGSVQVDPRSPVSVQGTVQVSGETKVQTDPEQPTTIINIADESHLITTQYCADDSSIFNPNLGLSTRFAGLVPTGKRLIVDYVSVYLTAPTGERGSAWVRAWNPLSPIKDEKHGRVFIPMTFQGNFDPIGTGGWAVMDGTTTMRTFADEGWYIDVVFPTSASPTSGVWTCQATVMGHVVPKIDGLIVQNP